MTEDELLLGADALLGGLSGAFVEFEYLPWLLDYLGEPGRPGPDWGDVLAELRYDMAQKGVTWKDNLPGWPEVEEPWDYEAVEGAWQLCKRVGLIEQAAVTENHNRVGVLTESGRGVAALAESGPGDVLSTGSDREACRDVLAPILAKGVEAALVGQDGFPLVRVLRDGVGVARRGGYSPFTERLPGLLPAEVAAIIHYGCMDIESAAIMVADIEPSREMAFDVQALPDEDEEITKFIYEKTTMFCMNHLMGLDVPLAELFGSARLLAYSGLFESVSVFPPATEPFYLVAG